LDLVLKKHAKLTYLNYVHAKTLFALAVVMGSVALSEWMALHVLKTLTAKATTAMLPLVSVHHWEKTALSLDLAVKVISASMTKCS